MEELLNVFLRTREVLSRPKNDFVWSGWKDAHEALEAVDCIIAELRAGKLPHKGNMVVLFLATGPIQEVALCSGWGDEFLMLSADFDDALDRALK